MKRAKKEAKQLLDKMFSVEDELSKYPMCYDTAKACALICVDKIQDELIFVNTNKSMELFSHYQDVKRELNKLFN